VGLAGLVGRSAGSSNGRKHERVAHHQGCMAHSTWRSEVGLLEKHSRAKPSLFFGPDEFGG
jgi:hypothetical protein